MVRGRRTRALLRRAITEYHPGRIALVASFGAESAVTLHMLAAIDPATPVIFLDTGKLFPETLAYRDTLARHLGLTDLRVAAPAAARLAVVDPAGDLWAREPDQCCWQRKVEPLDAALEPFDAWITGRKRAQSAGRAALELIETDEGGRVKFNPLASWSEAEVDTYFRAHGLPEHPLKAKGYRSIGCAPCTRPTDPTEDARAGRWAGRGKTECGIHERAA